MKKVIITIVILIVNNLVSFAQTSEAVQEVSAPIQSAIVYLYGAEVSQTKQVSLNAGKNKIVFTGLSPKLNSKSIQVNVSGDVAILAISDAINYMANQKESGRIKQLKDSLKSLNESIAVVNDEKEAYTIEKNMLLKNDAMGGTEKAVAIAELKLAADFYRTRIKEINTELFSFNQKINHLNEAIIKTNQQLMELNAKNNQPSAEISILLSSAIKTNTTISLKYIVTDAGWAPSYELRAEDINLPIELKYRAKVFNNTGVDWNDIKIKLSTADPSQSAAKPVLSAWNLDYTAGMNYKKNYNSVAFSNSNSAEGYMQNAPVSMDKYSANGSSVKEQMVQPVKFEEIQVSELSADFDIKNNYSIPSDSKPYIVDVTEYKLPATFQHYSAPKVVRDAFLLARITGWEDLDLVEGPANVYYGGTYIGQSYIYTRSVDDTLDLSLGRDNKVLVTRSKVKEYCNKKLFGSTVKETFAYEMVVKNNRKTPVQIDIQDQLPISTQSDILVESIETSKAELDPKTGQLTWSYNLQPGEVKKIALSFSIKYPKNATINVQKTKTQMRAAF